MSSLRETLGRRFAVTYEVVPPRGGSTAPAVEQVARVARLVDGVNVTDGSMARLRMAPIALAVRIQEDPGVEAILQVTTRDRNVLALQADLLAAHELGVRNILALTGDPVKLGDHPKASEVYDLWGSDLVSLVKRLNGGVSQSGTDLEGETDFFVGTATRFGPRDAEAEHILNAKIEAGADFFQTQITYDAARVAGTDFPDGMPPVLVGVCPPASRKNLDALARIPGVEVPDALRRMLDGSDDLPAAFAEYYLGLIEQAGDRIAGVHVMPIRRKNPTADALIEALQPLRGQPLSTPTQVKETTT